MKVNLIQALALNGFSPHRPRAGHIEPSSLKKQHAKAIAEGTAALKNQSLYKDARIVPFELYTFRHTCLTRWAPHMDPWTLAYLAGHRDMNITKRYVHPQRKAICEAMEKAKVASTGHTFGHTGQQDELTDMPLITPIT